MSTTYQPKFKAYEHQVAALEKARGKEAFSYLMAMRTGKSKTLIDEWGEMELAGLCQDLLIEAPGGVYRTWEKQFADHASDDLQSRAVVHVWVSGDSKKQDALRKQLLSHGGPRVLLLNCEALSRPGAARDYAEKFLDPRNGRIKMMAIDESVLNKNPTAKRTKYNNRVLRPMAQYRRILSGLATPRSPMDLYAQFEFLDWRILGHRSFFTFRNRYAILKPQWFGGRRVDVIEGYRNQDELRELIEPYSYRVEFRPKIPSTYSIREVELTAEQRRIYAEIKEYATAQLSSGEHVTATVVIAQLLRLHQVLCGHVKDEQGVTHEIPENRTAELLALLDDYAGKAIIWCSYDADVRKVSHALAEEYGEMAVARFWGGNSATREQEELAFKASSSCRFMVSTPDAGRFGRTWDMADLVVFYSCRNDLDHREQAEQRPLGVNKDRQVDYVDLIAPDTVETKILEALREKIDLAAQINGDNWREWLI